MARELAYLKIQLAAAAKRVERCALRLEALLFAVDELQAETVWFSKEDLCIA